MLVIYVVLIAFLAKIRKLQLKRVYKCMKKIVWHIN